MVEGLGEWKRKWGSLPGKLRDEIIRTLEQSLEVPVELVNPFKNIIVDAKKFDVDLLQRMAPVAAVAALQCVYTLPRRSPLTALFRPLQSERHAAPQAPAHERGGLAIRAQEGDGAEPDERQVRPHERDGGAQPQGPAPGRAALWRNPRRSRPPVRRNARRFFP